MVLALAIPVPTASADNLAPALAGNQTVEALRALAFPRDHARWSHLETGRIVNDRLALAAAIRRAASIRDGSTAPLRERILHYKRPRTARQIAATLHREYGGGSLILRGADAIATIAIAAEDTTQVPLDRLNSITGTIFEAGTRALGIGATPQLKLRSGISTDRAGVTLSTKW